jgi:hypothetical protein
MSRNIPQDQALSAEDRQYLLDRGRESLVERLDEEHGVVDGSDEETEAEPYTKWTVAELVSEINERNVGRSEGEQLSTKGTKAELVARLEEDDEE